MNSFKKLLACCIALLSFQSCTSILYINTTLPPEVAVTNEQWKVVTLNRVNPELLPYSREKKLDVFMQAANEAHDGVTEAILQDPTFSLVAADTSTQFIQAAPNQQLTPEQVQAIYSQHPHHLILALEQFDSFFDKEVVREKDGDGSVTKTAHYTLVTRTSWTLYDSTGAVLDMATLSRNEPYDSRGVLSGLLAIGPSISNAGSVINNLAWHTGMDYWERLHPKQMHFERLYYSNKEFSSAAFKMAASEWEEAVALLTPIAQSTKRKNAAKAAYNLAIVHEAKGDIAEAKKWARQAAEKGNKMALLLLPDLEKYSSKNLQ
ncbi:MAG: tetratricopeptide repeat protein [Hymenobacteraceae bacterium]|nr:tetratricopeptide repeat protein [Hymenobacteraceae bacterium]